MASAAAAVAIAVHHLIRPPSSSTCPSLSYLKPFLHRTLPTFFSSSSLRLFFTPSTSLTHLLIPSPIDSYHPINPSEEEEYESEDDDDEEEEDFESQPQGEEEVEGDVVTSEIPITITAASAASVSSSVKAPELSIKEKKELAAYAHSLGKKLKIQQVGKSGVTSSLATSFIETLEANEILKLKVHNSCPGEMPDVVRQLEEATGSVAVGQIGRSVILYRPSLRKMEEAEKKKQQLRRRFSKPFRPKPTEAKKKPVWRVSNRGRRGSSRFET
ncbi:putative RNA-binding YqeI [Cinnamomum micranthum f. kanehirae]|uniref:Putative RNA-binding YqeI n=1 Tax=Cinnamomum micranthum f. kanehirae TaxID=337451 RepID=A0A3S3MTL9_9MAGN|nr:putative RNA-binding YqeI [Cinnamomum micranthum f. kanehirae]